MLYTPTATLRQVKTWGPENMPLWARELFVPSPGPGATGSAMSNYLEDELLDHVLSNATFSAAGTLYYALFSVAPSDTGGGEEVSGGSYARQSVTNNATNFPAASGGSKSNGALVDFGTSTGPWGTVGYMALIDAATSGNYYFWGSLDVSIPIVSGDSLSFPVGTLTFALD